MIESLQHFDLELFLNVHKSLSNCFFDWLMPLLRNQYFWAPLYLFMVVFGLREFNKRGWYMIGMTLFTFGMGDFISSQMIKKFVGRIRPCNDISIADEIIHRVHCGSGYSFPSSHATNHFAIAVFLILIFYNKWKPILPIGLSWAFLISFAQVYVGVHYPLDTFAGAILGTCIAMLSSKLYKTLPHI